MRLVVTGQDDAGSHIVEDAEIEQTVVDPCLMSRTLWAAEERPVLPTAGGRPPAGKPFPPTDGYRFMTLTIAPDETAGTDSPALRMHTTDTVDFGVVLRGKIVLEVDTGAAVTLLPGQAFVQNGTAHSWANPGDEPATMAIVMVGAHREDREG